MGNEENQWSYLEVGISGGMSRVITSRSITPIRLFNPRVNASSCHVFVSNYGGGMVDGDAVRLKVICREDARLHIGSVGNLHIYKGPTKGCSQIIEGFLENNALCVLNSEPIVLHSGSNLEQKQTWNVHPESSLLIAEWVIAGRLETGERFTFSQYVNEITVLMDGHVWMMDRFEFAPHELNYYDPALFAGLACLLNVYMVGPKWGPLERLLTLEIDRSGGKTDSRFPVSIHPVRGHGYILRALSDSRSDLIGITNTIYDFVSHPDYLGFNPTERKY
jgi:urease accessory protein